MGLVPLPVSAKPVMSVWSPVPARVRTGGTIISLNVRQGDFVKQGQIIAMVGDPKLALQSNAYAAQVGAARAQVEQAKADFDRAQRLIGAGAIARNMFDQARTNYNVAQRTVVMPGDAVATVAQQNFVLRLEVPERHARFLKAGDPVRLDGTDLGLSGPQFGQIALVYPDVDKGHVVADAIVTGIGDYFVGQRVRVWVSGGTRTTILVPQNLIITRAGIDYARILAKDGGAIEVPVQRGQEVSRPGKAIELEILSGLKAGDRLLKP